jgi:hypothetical protein
MFMVNPRAILSRESLRDRNGPAVTSRSFWILAEPAWGEDHADRSRPTPELFHVKPSACEKADGPSSDGFAASAD